MTKHQSLDIVLPCYNPAPNWARQVIDSYNAIRHQIDSRIPVTLYIVNDGSVRGVEAADVQQLESNIEAVHVVQYPVNKGKGYALRTGVAEGYGDLIIFTDIDFPYSEKSLLAVYQKLCNGADAVIGTREEGYYADVPRSRVVISKFLKKCIKLFLRLPVDDTQCGLKGFNKSTKAIFLQTRINRYLFDIEFIYLLSKVKGVSIVTQRVELKPGVKFSSMHFRILVREGLNFTSIFLRQLLRSNNGKKVSA